MKRKQGILILIFMLVFQSLYLPFIPTVSEQYTAHAEDVYRPILISAYFEFWQDPSTGKWLYDDGSGNRRTFGGPSSTVSSYRFPSANVPNYKIRDVEIYDPAKTYNKLEKWTAVDIGKIDRHIAQSINLKNKLEIVGKEGTVIMEADVTLLNTNTSEKYSKDGIWVYKNYIPVVIYFESVAPKTPKEPELDPILTVEGESNPNPVKLVGGKADVKITVKSMVSNLQDKIKTWKISYQKPSGEWSDKLYKSYNGDEVQNTFESVEITGDTIFPIKAELITDKDKKLEATGQVHVKTFIEDGGSGEDPYTLNVDIAVATLDSQAVANMSVDSLWDSHRIESIEFTRYEMKNNVPKPVKLLIDAYQYESSQGVDSLFYTFRKDFGKRTKQTFTSGQAHYVSDEILVFPQEIGLTGMSEKEVEFRGNVTIYDRDGHQALSPVRRDSIKAKVVAVPPTTKLQMPKYFFPKEVTDIGTIRNLITWDYNSPDEAEYKNSIVSLYKLDDNEKWQPVFEKQIFDRREFIAEGYKDEEFKIQIQVVDQDGLTSEIVEETFVIVNADPIIEVKWDTKKIKENILGIDVKNLTPIEIEHYFPTEYTHWEIYDAYGILLENGTGKAPESVTMDERYYGNVITIIQHARNSLKNTAKDTDRYIDYPIIDFEIDPDRLYEEELTTVYDKTKAISEKQWKIKQVNESDEAYAELAFTDENKFTRPAGRYFVKLEGDGKYGSYSSDYQYSNNRKTLRNDPTRPTDAKIHAVHGENSDYVYLSAEWDGNIEEGNFTADGVNYKYRKKFTYAILTKDHVNMIKPVQFLDAKPVAKLTISGTKKMFKKVSIDGTESDSETAKKDPILAAKYPIQFEHEKTVFVIEPLNDDGTPDYSKNKYIKGIGRKEIDGKVVFPGNAEGVKDPRKRDIRFDKDGRYRVTYKVFNGLKESDWVNEELVIKPELLPAVDINIVGDAVIFRKTDTGDQDLELGSTLNVSVNYSSPDDEIDLDRSKLFISYDANNDGDFTNDGEHSKQWIMKDSENLLDYLSVSSKDFQLDGATFSLFAINDDRNLMGRFKFEFEVYEKPSIPNFDILGDVAGVKADTLNLDDSKKIIFIDNQKPVITLKTERWKAIEIVWIEETDSKLSEENIKYIFDTLELNKVRLTYFKYINLDGTVTVYEKKDGAIIKN